MAQTGVIGQQLFFRPPVVGPLERALKKPVITANLAALWGALDQIGHGHRFVFEESRLLEWQKKANA